MSLLEILLLGTAGLFMGLRSGPGWSGVLGLLLLGIPFAAIGLFFLSFCRTLTLADMLVLRYVSDRSCLLGGFESNEFAIPYACLAGSAIAAIRVLISKSRDSDGG